MAITYNRFKQNPDLAQALIATYPKIIINDSNHSFWGKESNMFGKVLMHVRTLLLNENQYLHGHPGKEITRPIIMQVNSLQEIATMLGVLPSHQQSFFAFDIDYTLLKWGKVQGKAGIVGLVEDGNDWKDNSRLFVEHIQKYSPAIALSNAYAQSKRGKTLSKWGISFAHATARLNLPDNLTVNFPDLTQMLGHTTQIPVLRDGVLLTGQFKDSERRKVFGITKGQLLGAFIDYVYQQTKWAPTYVYMVDDVRVGLDSIAEELSARGILFFGFWYGKIRHSSSYSGGAYFKPELVKQK